MGIISYPNDKIRGVTSDLNRVMSDRVCRIITGQPKFEDNLDVSSDPDVFPSDICSSTLSSVRLLSYLELSLLRQCLLALFPSRLLFMKNRRHL